MTRSRRYIKFRQQKAYTLIRLCNTRASKPDILGNVLFIKCERLLEHASELPNLPLECLLVWPRQAGVQQLPRDALDTGGYRQTKGAEVLEVGFGKFARVDSVDDGAS